MTSEPMTSLAEELPADTVIPASPEPDQDKARDPRKLLDELRARFEVFRTYQPLAIGIDKAIRSRLPEADRKTLRVALSMHTHCNRYLRLLAKAEQRFDLDGEAVAEVSEEHRQFATTVLEERSQRQAINGEAKQSKPSEHKNHPKHIRSRKPAHRAESDTPVNGAASAAFAQAAEKPKGAHKSPEKRRHEKSSGNKREARKNAVSDANGISTDTPQAPEIPATLAEKLVMLTEKFGRK